mmetsp:Transcript_16211/g.27850  ORF Transcript_16211/g.27850 Transcript_16211/m.27850 type:complete len:222 (+) Transcript_16211:1394-2059(+)
MPKFVAHEAQPRLTPQGHGDSTDHLVHCDAPLHHWVCRGQRAHASVHLLVHEPEGDCHVTNKGLIVAFRVPHGALSITPIAERAHNLHDTPVFILFGLQQLNPLVWNCHAQPKVKAQAALGHWAAQGWHATHIFSNHNRIRHQLMDEVVCQHQICACVHVGVKAKVLRIVATEATVDAVVLVKHGGHTVKSEPIKLVLVQPPTEIGQQITDCFPVAVVQAA